MGLALPYFWGKAKGVGDALKRPKKGVGESGESNNRKKQRIRVVVEPKGNDVESVFKNGSKNTQNNNELTTNTEKHLEAVKDGKECEISQQNEHKDNALLDDVRQGDIFGQNDDDGFGVFDLVGENSGENSGEGISDFGESSKELESPKLVLELNGENLDGSFFRPVVDIEDAMKRRHVVKEYEGESFVGKIMELKEEHNDLMNVLRVYRKAAKTEESKLRKHDEGNGEGRRESVEARLMANRKAIENTEKRIMDIRAKVYSYMPNFDFYS